MMEHIHGHPIEFDYDQRTESWKWHWAMWSYGNLIAQSTYPHDDEESCIEQIGQVINLIRIQNVINVTNRSGGAVTSFTVVER